jgi:hypothetical protein
MEMDMSMRMRRNAQAMDENRLVSRAMASIGSGEHGPQKSLPVGRW